MNLVAKTRLHLTLTLSQKKTFGNSLILLGLLLKFEWKINFVPNFFLTEKAGIIFQQCAVVSYNLFIQEHCRQVNLFGIWTLLMPPFSLVLHRVECLILGCFQFQINSFWILFNWSTITCWTFVTKAQWITFEIAKLLKIVILP